MYRLGLLLVAFVLVARGDDPGITVDPGGPLLHRSDVVSPVRQGGVTEGTLVLELSLDENGLVTGIVVVSGPAELRPMAFRSVADWHYSSEMTLPAKVQATISYKRPGPPPDLEPAFQMPTEPLGKLLKLSIRGLSQPAHDALVARLPIHEGDALNPDLVEKARQIALAFDSHIFFTIRAMPQGSLIRMEAPGQTELYASAGGSPDTPQRIRVGGNVQAANLLSYTPPVMPPLAEQARISGVVRLDVIIGKDGHVENVTLRSGHPLLVPPAIESVKTYVYRPTLLNGQPVEVVTQVEVRMPGEPGGAVPPPSGPTPQ
jgi:hypothetical protein